MTDQLPQKLPENEIEWIKKMSANPLTTLLDIKSKYEILFAPKKIDGAAIQRVQSKHHEDIVEMQANLLDLKNIPVVSTAVRLLLLQEVISNARKEKLKGAVRVDLDRWEKIEDRDDPIVINALKLVKDELHGLKKLKLEQMKVTGDRLASDADVTDDDFGVVESGV